MKREYQKCTVIRRHYGLNQHVLFFSDTSNSSRPHLISPANGDFVDFEQEPVTFKWTPVSGASNYTLQLDRTSFFNSARLIEIRGINDTEYTFAKNSLSADEWFWRVLAVFSNGTVVASEIWHIYGIPPSHGASESDVTRFMYTTIAILCIVIVVGIFILTRPRFQKSKRSQKEEIR